MRLVGQTIHGQYVWEVSGSGFAGPMWADAMHAIQGGLDYQDFVAPGTTTVNGVPATVPSTSGMSVAEAEATLEQAGFNALRGGTAYSTSPVGTVAYTSPSGGAYIPKGSVVTIYESNGQAPPKPPKGRGNGGRGGGNGGGNGNGNGGRGGR